MIEQRRTVNSQFDNQLEEFNSYSDYLSVPEKGAIIYSNGRAFYGNGESWIELANINDIPEAANGYCLVEDTEHSNVGNAQSLIVTENKIANDGKSITGSLECWDALANAFILRSQVIYTVSISFTALVTANNQHAQVFLGGGGLPWYGLSTIITFPKGNNVAHEFYFTFQIVGDDTTATTGIIPYIHPSHDGKLWNAKFTVQRAF